MKQNLNEWMSERTLRSDRIVMTVRIDKMKQTGLPQRVSKMLLSRDW